MYMRKQTFDILYRNNRESKGHPLQGDNKGVKSLKRKLQGKTLSQIDSEFYSYIFELINEGSAYSAEEKNATVIDMTEYYYQQTGCVAPNAMLSALADYLLDDTLADKSSNKAKTNEYSILSHSQIRKRNKKLSLVESSTLEYLDNKIRLNTSHKRNTSEQADNQ